MIGSTRAVKVWAWCAPTDLRKGYSGLYAMVRSELQQDPLSGHFYLFANRRRTSCKVLHWDGTGLCIYMKRLEKGRFPPLWGRDERVGGSISLTASELSLFLEGCRELARKRLSPPEVPFP